jgi:CYTH domain-containing protein
VIDKFESIEQNPMVLRIDTSVESKEIKIPAFIKVIRDVTKDSQYYTHTMAIKGF